MSYRTSPCIPKWTCPTRTSADEGKQLVARAIIKQSDGSKTDMEQVLHDAFVFWGIQVTNEAVML